MEINSISACLGVCTWDSASMKSFIGYAFGSVWLMLGYFLAAEPIAKSEQLPRLPPTEPKEALKKFQIADEFRIELAAAEPEVVDPVSMSFDATGRLYVVEMIGYSERRDDRAGRVRLLEDLDADGRFEKSTVFATDLAWPTGVICWKGGVFVIVTPDLLYFRDMDGDGVADERKVILTGFGKGSSRLNMQALPNSLRWGLDNRIYGVTSSNGAELTCHEKPERKPLRLRGSDFSFDPRTLDLRMELGGSQHGASFDENGRRYVSSNSRHIQYMVYDTKYAHNPEFAMPAARVSIAVDGDAAPVYRTSPDEPWRIVRTRWRIAGKVRGPVEGGGRVSGYFTAATGVTAYNGGLFGNHDTVFIADAGSNLVHRKLLRDTCQIVPIAMRPVSEQVTEFLASTDNWFRPVQLGNGPDGALYILDMYREVIEHPWSLPQGIKQYLDLNSGNDRGRIWRVLPKDFQSKGSENLQEASSHDLVKMLASSNGWIRETASRLLYERQDKSVIPQLEKVALEEVNYLGRLHALYVLQGLEALDTWVAHRALSDKHPVIREHGLKLSEPILPTSKALQESALALAKDPILRVRFQLALTLGIVKVPGERSALKQILQQNSRDKWVLAAVQNALPKSEWASINIPTNPKTSKPIKIPTIPKLPANNSKVPRQQVVNKYMPALGLQGDFVKGEKIFKQRCFTCHLSEKEGHRLGPDLATMKAAGKEKLLTSVLDPSREIAADFEAYEVRTKQGTHLGLLANETPTHLTIRFPLGQSVTFLRREVLGMKSLGRSIMPDGLESELNIQDMADLLAFLAK
jgi:putative membrane-bound dehydrogenase-like protein